MYNSTHIYLLTPILFPNARHSVLELISPRRRRIRLIHRYNHTPPIRRTNTILGRAQIHRPIQHRTPMLIRRIDPKRQRPDRQLRRSRLPIRPDPQCIQILELHIPRPGRDPDAGKHSSCPCGRRDDGKGVELQVAGGEGADAVSGIHGLGVELIDLPVAVGLVAASAGVVDRGRTGLGEEGGHEVVELVAREPVTAQTVGVDAFELRDPPGGTAGDLFGECAVFVDVDGAEWEVVLGEDGAETAVRRDQVAAAAFHVPGILVRDGFVLGDEGGVGRPPCVVGEGFTGAGRTGEEDFGTEFAAEAVVSSSPHLEVLFFATTPEYGAEIWFVPDVNDHGFEHVVSAHVRDYMVKVVIPVGPGAVVAWVRG